jgi:hypothetical protein
MYRVKRYRAMLSSWGDSLMCPAMLGDFKLHCHVPGLSRYLAGKTDQEQGINVIA